MENTRELLAAVKRRHHLTSDYQLAKFLNLSRQRISANLHGGTILNDEAAILVADALGIERGRVLAIVAAERAQSDQAKKEWLKLAGTAAAVVVVALLGAEHGAQLVDAVSAATPSLYIMSNVALFLVTLAAAIYYRSRRAMLAFLALFNAAPLEARAADPWDTADKTLGTVALAAIAADCSQTRTIARNPDRYRELNPILGEHPSERRVNTVCATSAIGTLLIAHALNSEQRKLFLGGVALIEIYVTHRNRQIGLSVRF